MSELSGQSFLTAYHALGPAEKCLLAPRLPSDPKHLELLAKFCLRMTFSHQ